MTKRMRTTIVLNDDLVREAQRYSRAKSKSALIEEALRVLVELRSGQERRRAYEEGVNAVQRALQSKRFRTSARQLVRG